MVARGRLSCRTNVRIATNLASFPGCVLGTRLLHVFEHHHDGKNSHHYCFRKNREGGKFLYSFTSRN